MNQLHSLGFQSRVCLLAILVAGTFTACKSDTKTAAGKDASTDAAAPAKKDSGTPDSGGSTPDVDAGVDAGGTTDPHPNSSAADVASVCKTMADCDLIPGKNITEAYCSAHVSDACITCAKGVVNKGSGADGGASDGGASSSCPPKIDMTCSDPCGFLVQPPDNKSDCLEIANSGERPGTKTYQNCLCTTCLQQFAACKDNDDCWTIVQCSVHKNCNGMACYMANTCMAVIDKIGVTSIGTTLSTELGNCTVACPGQ